MRARYLAYGTVELVTSHMHLHCWTWLKNLHCMLSVRPPTNYDRRRLCWRNIPALWETLHVCLFPCVSVLLLCVWVFGAVRKLNKRRAYKIKTKTRTTPKTKGQETRRPKQRNQILAIVQKFRKVRSTKYIYTYTYTRKQRTGKWKQIKRERARREKQQQRRRTIAGWQIAGKQRDRVNIQCSDCVSSFRIPTYICMCVCVFMLLCLFVCVHCVLLLPVLRILLMLLHHLLSFVTDPHSLTLPWVMAINSRWQRDEK